MIEGVSLPDCPSMSAPTVVPGGSGRDVEFKVEGDEEDSNGLEMQLFAASLDDGRLDPDEAALRSMVLKVLIAELQEEKSLRRFCLRMTRCQPRELLCKVIVKANYP